MIPAEHRLRSLYLVVKVIGEVLEGEIKEPGHVSPEYLRGYQAGQKSTWNLVQDWLALLLPELATDESKPTQPLQPIAPEGL